MLISKFLSQPVSLQIVCIKPASTSLKTSQSEIHTNLWSCAILPSYFFHYKCWV